MRKAASLLTINLSTGYQVTIDLNDAREEGQHLARAIFGEVFFPEAKRTGKRHGYGPAIVATHKEVSNIVDGLKVSEKNDLLKALITTFLYDELDRLNSGDNPSGISLAE